MFWEIVSALMLLAALTQLVYFIYIGSPRPTYRQAPFSTEKALRPLSVIICAHNEASNLRRNLPSVLAQSYHYANGRRAFELIVVNDRSDDGTAAVLEEFARTHDFLRIVTIAPEEERPLPGKKFALSRGLAAASQDHLVLTDADCAPAGESWLRIMAAPFSSGKEIVAGYGGFRSEPGLLSAFVRSETVFTFAQMSGMARAGHPYMAVGRNLAVKRSLLEHAQETVLWRSMPSGDDDLMVRLCATSQNYTTCSDPSSFTYSRSHTALTPYLRQKQRHMSTGKCYRPLVKAWLGANGLSHSLIWVLMPIWIAGLIFANDPLLPYWVTGLALLLRFVAFYALMQEWSVRLRERSLFAFLPVFDLLLAAYSIILSPYILWKSRQRWK